MFLRSNKNMVKCKCGNYYKYFKNKPKKMQLVCPKCRKEDE